MRRQVRRVNLVEATEGALDRVPHVQAHSQAHVVVRHSLVEARMLSVLDHFARPFEARDEKYEGHNAHVRDLADACILVHLQITLLVCVHVLFVEFPYKEERIAYVLVRCTRVTVDDTVAYVTDLVHE